MADLIERESALDVLSKASIGGSITERINAIPAANQWISCSERLPDMRTRVFVVAVRNREHYPKDTEPSRMFIAMRIEMLSDDNWYWARATDIYGHDGIGGMLALGGWEVVAWMPLPEPPETEQGGERR